MSKHILLLSKTVYIIPIKGNKEYCPKDKQQVAQRAMIAHLRAIINILGIFRCSRAANSTVRGPIWLKIELIQNIMYVLITCKFKKYWINSNREKVKTSIFYTLQGILLPSKSSDLAEIQLIKALIHVLITSKYQKFVSKQPRNSEDTICSIISLWGYFLNFQGQIIP